MTIPNEKLGDMKIIAYLCSAFAAWLLMACTAPQQEATGTFLNPILAGDYPDPTVVRVDSDYYMTHSSFCYMPGLTVLHSRDLVHWEPLGAALNEYLGAVWAPDISYCNGRYWIYFTVDSSVLGIGEHPYATWMVSAERPEGPWSKPVKLETGHWIDPCHVADAASGERWLFLSGGYRIRLNAEGDATVGELEKVYDGWPIPEGWTYEGFALEGPKVRRVGDWWYMLSAEGGTAGPPTAHMAVVARAAQLEGPWQDMPRNPLVHTYGWDETWWCRGHASLIDTPSGAWWLVSHGYLKDYVGLGRQTLLEPITWDAAGWPVAPLGAGIDQPIKSPDTGTAVQPRETETPTCETQERSRRLGEWRIGEDWRFYKAYDTARIVNRHDGALTLRARGTTPADGSPLLCIAGSETYEMQVKVTLRGDVQAGLLGFYDERFYAGIGYDRQGRFSWRRGAARARSDMEGPATIWLRLRNEHQILTGWYSTDGEHWDRQTWGYEVSGYNHNTAGGFMSLLPGIVVTGEGEATFEELKILIDN